MVRFDPTELRGLEAEFRAHAQKSLSFQCGASVVTFFYTAKVKAYLWSRKVGPFCKILPHGPSGQALQRWTCRTDASHEFITRLPRHTADRSRSIDRTCAT